MVTGMNDPVEYGKTGKGFWKVLLTLFLLGLLTGCGAGAENNISGRAGAPDAAGGSDLSDGSLPAAYFDLYGTIGNLLEQNHVTLND